MGTLTQPGSGRPADRGLLALARELRRRALRDDVSTHASALTFTAFVSIFPLLLLATSVMGFRLQDRGMESIDELVQTVPGLDQLVHGQGQAIVDGRYTAGILGLLGLVWAASALSARARHALGVVFERPEATIRGRLTGIGITIILGVLVLAGVTVAGVLTSFIHDRGATIAWLLGQAAMFALLILFFLVCYRLLVPGRQSFRTLLPAALVCSLGWTVLQGIGSWFVARQVAQWSVLYGTIATVFGVLLFLRIAAWVFLTGAELAATLRARSPAGTAQR